MTVIQVGSIVLGKSGRSLVVDRVDGDIICGGGVKIRATAACRVIPPPLIEDNMSPDNIQAVAETLSLTCTFEEVAAIEVLTELRKIWDRDLLKAAARLLTAEERRLLTQIVVTINSTNN